VSVQRDMVAMNPIDMRPRSPSKVQIPQTLFEESHRLDFSSQRIQSVRKVNTPEEKKGGGEVSRKSI
jgi:hypothetical protein